MFLDLGLNSTEFCLLTIRGRYLCERDLTEQMGQVNRQGTARYSRRTLAFALP